MLEPFEGQVRRAADAERRVVELARVRLRVGHQFPEVVDRQFRIHQDHFGREDQLRDRLDVLLRIEGQVFVKVGVERMARGNHADGVAVRRRLGAGVGADDGVGAGAVFNHQRLAGLLVEVPAQRTHQHVDARAHRQRHQHLDRVAWVGLGRVLGHCRRCQHGG